MCADDIRKTLWEMGFSMTVRLTDQTKTRESYFVKLRKNHIELRTTFFQGAQGSCDIVDVIHCIVLDAQSVWEYPRFESWAREFGYDADSRKAEAVYNAVIAQTSKLRKMLKRGEFEMLVELFQDY